MAWNLHAANLSDGAKAYLSALGSCGDERKAAAEVGATDAEVRNWARDGEFIVHRQHALAHFKSWESWTPPSQHGPADQWPSAVGRLDQRNDPFRVADSVDQLLGRDRP